MISQSSSRRLLGAVLFSLAISVFSVRSDSQTNTPAPNPSTVFSNPRAAADDPRVGLKPGLYDAGEAAFGMEKLISIPKAGSFAPGNNPTEKTAEASDLPPTPPKDGKPRERPLTYGSTNSDFAFSGNHVFVGNYNGISFYDVDNPKQIKLVTSLVCPGGQGDVSVYGHLLFMSAEAMNGRIDCGTQGVPLPEGYVPPPTPEAKPADTTAKTTDAAGGKTAESCPRRHFRDGHRHLQTATDFVGFAFSTSAIFRIRSR